MIGIDPVIQKIIVEHKFSNKIMQLRYESCLHGMIRVMISSVSFKIFERHLNRKSCLTEWGEYRSDILESLIDDILD